MQSRMVVNLINQGTIFGDWQQGVTQKESEDAIEKQMMPNFGSLTYLTVPVNGHPRFVNITAVSDFFVEERDETAF